MAISKFGEKNREGTRRWGVETLGDLNQCIEESHVPTPLINVVDEVWDWIGLLQVVSLAKIEGSMSNRAFEFSLSKTGTVQMAFRPWLVPPPEHVSAVPSMFHWDGNLGNIPYFGPVSVPGYHLTDTKRLKPIPRHPVDTVALRKASEVFRDAGVMSEGGCLRFSQELSQKESMYDDDQKRRTCTKCTQLIADLRAIVIHQSDSEIKNAQGQNLNTQRTNDRSG